MARTASKRDTRAGGWVTQGRLCLDCVVTCYNLLNSDCVLVCRLPMQCHGVMVHVSTAVIFNKMLVTIHRHDATKYAHEQVRVTHIASKSEKLAGSEVPPAGVVFMFGLHREVRGFVESRFHSWMQCTSTMSLK